MTAETSTSPNAIKMGKRETKLLEAIAAVTASGDFFTRKSVTASKLHAAGLVSLKPTKSVKLDKRNGKETEVHGVIYKNTAAGTAALKKAHKEATAA